MGPLVLKWQKKMQKKNQEMLNGCLKMERVSAFLNYNTKLG